MNDISETTVLEERNVKITNLRAIIGTKTYPMSNITSVNLSTKSPSWGPRCLIAYGVIFIFSSVINDPPHGMSLAQAAELILFGLLLIGAGIFAARSTKS